MNKIRTGVITFPGSNCDTDIFVILRDFFSCDVKLIWHADRFTEKFDLIVVPGGFSYGDYLRAGAIARFAKAMESLQEHARRGGAILGICNGFQILCEAHLLPGALIRNNSLLHVAKSVEILANDKNPLASGMKSGKKYLIPVSHGDGNYRVDENTLEKMKENNQIVFRYAQNPNGSVENIAGITDAGYKILGMMPHPERAVDPVTGGIDGRTILSSFLSKVI